MEVCRFLLVLRLLLLCPDPWLASIWLWLALLLGLVMMMPLMMLLLMLIGVFYF